MLTELPRDVSAYHLYPFLDCESKTNLSKILHNRGDFIQKFANSYEKFGQELLSFRIKYFTKRLLPIIHKPLYFKGTTRLWAIIVTFRTIVKPEYIFLLKYNPSYRTRVLQKTAEFTSGDMYESSRYIPKKWIKFLQKTAAYVRGVVDANPLIIGDNI
jgi:hypothetical protein